MNMRRLALKSSSAKKGRSNSETHQSIVARLSELNPSQLQEFLKINKVFKTNLVASSKRTSVSKNQRRADGRGLLEDFTELPDDEDLEM
jgi:hypothetical protein